MSTIGDDPARGRQVRRQEGRPDGQRVADEEVAQVVREDAGIDGHDRARSPGARGTRRCPTPVTNMASVDSMNGAPRMAPTPTSWDPSAVANTIAMIGMSVSGRAVPTAASTDPTAPSPRPSLRPIHSMPLVKSSAANRMTTRLTSRTRTSVSHRRRLGEHGDHASEDGISAAGRPAGSRRRPSHATSGRASIGASRAEYRSPPPRAFRTVVSPVEPHRPERQAQGDEDREPDPPRPLADPEQREREQARLEQRERRATAPDDRDGHRGHAPDDRVARPDLERRGRPGEAQRDERPDRGPRPRRDGSPRP